MKYDKENIQKAKDMGIFDDSFDAPALQLDEEEKRRMNEEFTRSQAENQPPDLPENEAEVRKRRKQLSNLNVELTFFERIILFFLSIFGIQTQEQFKLRKIVKNTERELGKIKPPIYNSHNKRITKYFAFKIHDLYLKLIWIKKIFDNTFNNQAKWDNPMANKTVVEAIFEALSAINTDEVESKFSVRGIELILNQFDDPKRAIETLEKSLYTYVYSIDKATIENVNKIYTNLVYFKNLTEFDFVAFFKRFDPTFHPGVSPNFTDIPGDALVPYLRQLEENILQIDLAMDNIFIFKNLAAISKRFAEEKLAEQAEVTDISEIPEADEMPVEKIENELIVLFEILKELMYKKHITLIIQVVKSDPLYSPAFVHTRYDLFKLYLETFEKRIKTSAKIIIKDKKKKKIMAYARKLFSQIDWVGIYSLQLSEELEQNNYLGFSYAFHIAIINSFLRKFFDDLVRPAINILMLNAIFSERNFHKMVSDTFYNLDKFKNDFDVFCVDMKNDGNSGKRILNLLSKKQNFQNEHKNMVEKAIVSVNGRARDLYEEFNKIFFLLNDIVSKVYLDIDAKPPKFIRNIRGIGGFRNVKFLQQIEKTHKLLGTMKEIMGLLKNQ